MKLISPLWIPYPHSLALFSSHFIHSLFSDTPPPFPPSLISPVIVCVPDNWKIVRRKLLAKGGKGTSPLALMFIVYHQGVRHSVCMQGHALSSPFPLNSNSRTNKNDAPFLRWWLMGFPSSICIGAESAKTKTLTYQTNHVTKCDKG